MKFPLLHSAVACCLLPAALSAQVLPSGGSQPSTAPGVDSGTQSQPQKKEGVLGNVLPFMDPASETVHWDGKMFSVTNNRVFRAMLETYLAAPEASTADDQAYRDVLDSILKILSPSNNGGRPDLPSAVALLPIASQYKADARLCDSLANAIWGAWQAQKNVTSLRATNEAMKRSIDSMHFQAEHRGAPLTQRPATSTKGGQQQPQSNQSQFGQLGMFANYIKNIAEYEARMKANEASMGVSQVTSKAEFQALILQFAVQRRFEHVVMACRFYRNIFSSDPNGTLQLNKGSDAEKMFATSLGASPTVGALDAFANEAMGKVDTAVQAFDNLLARGDIASASERIGEAYMIGEFLPRVQRVPAAKKLMVLDFTRDGSQLLSAMEVKDYKRAEELIVKMRAQARDFDYGKPLAIVETARTVSDMHLNEAKVAAMKGDQKAGADALRQAAEIYPTNPKLKEFTTMIGSNADVKTQAVLDLDRLLSQRNYRQIYNDQARYLAAVIDDPAHQELLKKVLTDMNKVNLIIAGATSNAQHGNLPGAWETIEKAYQEFPEDPEVARLRSDFSVKATEFVGALQKAKSHEERKQSGSALAWFLKARMQYPQSEFATEGIARIVKGLPHEASVE